MASKLALFSVSGLKEEKLIKKQTYMKNETCKLYSGDFWIFVTKIIKIDHYNSELYRFKVGAIFWDTVVLNLCIYFLYFWFVFCPLFSRTSNVHGTVRI